MRALEQLLTLTPTHCCPHTTQMAWDEGFAAYQQGAWPAAHALLKMCDQWKAGGKGDGPARVLMGFIEEHGFRAPAGWKGFRELTEK